MSLGPHWGQIQTPRQIVIAGTGEPGFLLKTLNNRLLHLAGEAAAGTEIHQAEARHIDISSEAVKVSQLMLKGVQREIDADFRRAIAMYQLAYHRQQRNFPHNNFKPGAGKANIQLAVVIDDRDLARVVAEAA